MITNTCENDGHPNPDFKVSATSVFEFEVAELIRCRFLLIILLDDFILLNLV